MRIFDVVQFDESEQTAIDRAARWLTVMHDMDLADEDKWAVATILKGRGGPTYTRPQLVRVRDLWSKVLETIKQRRQRYIDIAQHKTPLSNPTGAPEGHIPLIEPKHACIIFAGLAQNADVAITEFDAVLNILDAAILAMKDPPALEDEDSDEFLARNVDAVVVRR